MIKRNLLSAIPSLIGMTITLAVAFGLDYLIRTLNYRVAQNFSVSPIIPLIYPAANLILAICLLLLFWYVNFRAARSRFISITFLVAGLFLLVFWPVAMSLMILIPAFRLPTFPGLSYVWGRACTADALAGIATIGLLGLLLPHKTPLSNSST
jgi:hypothetical protein